MSKLMNPMRIRLDAELEAQLNALAAIRQESKAELCRRLLSNAVAQELAGEVVDPVLLMIRRAVEEAMQPGIERLAKINAKTLISSSTSMYMSQYLYEAMGKNGQSLHDAARKKAVGFMKMSQEKMMNEDSE
ncbi:hypothetical protein ACFOQM_04190 [Paenibacillus sp. GCM10012307]|uniref:Uncharacterized protein n=1 Tax=Paenibacillus roseus TaxID=2798579 RepID=A0A934J2Y9_9BACL|nr:CopG family transcriptional regulator [Paenibacillus roseus]MBJ6360513.1 hypothetical protein [Paenibacillus roseus]